MNIAFSTTSRIADHAVCMAAGFRDGLRATQYYVRDLSDADGKSQPGQRSPTPLSNVVARFARGVDRFMSWFARSAIAFLLPSWRNLPSPFAPGMVAEVAMAIRNQNLLQNPLFNAYFFRAALHILKHDNAESQPLVLEHRIDAARRRLAQTARITPAGPAAEDFLAPVLAALVAAGPIARVQSTATAPDGPGSIDPNIRVFATAVVALMFAEAGKPEQCLDEAEFFAIVGALLSTRLPNLTAALESNNQAALKRELVDIKALY
jgi:hypothetical protein